MPELKPLDEERGLDLPLALSRVGGHMDLLREIAALFLEDYPQSLASIHRAVKEHDAVALERSAHSLKGSACNFGAADVVRAAAELEIKARASEWADISAIAENLNESLALLKTQLEAVSLEP